MDEAVKECWLAATLEPDWELPLDEIGVIYYNAGRIEESRTHLEQIVSQRQHPPWNLLMTLGLARMRCGDTAGALAALEGSLEMEPNHPLVLGAAAHCASLLGKKWKAQRYEKCARLFGSWAVPEERLFGLDTMS